MPEQELAPLPIDAARGSARGAVLVDQTGGDPVAVHLVQWVSPAPVGAPMSTFLGHGYVKRAITYPDVAAKRAQLAAAGAELTNTVTVRNYLKIVDPDGVIVSFLQADASPTERLYHTCLSTISVEETTEFYRDVIGLDHWMQATVPSPVPASQGPGPTSRSSIPTSSGRSATGGSSSTVRRACSSTRPSRRRHPRTR